MTEKIPDIVDERPGVISWFKLYTGFLCLLYLLPTIAVFLSLFSATSAATDMFKEVGPVFAVLVSLLALALFVACLLPLILKPRPWLWTYNLIIICLGMTSACMLPASIPLLIFWIKPEARKYFGRT